MKVISKSTLLCLGLFGYSQLYAANQITITGRVIDSTCTLSGGDNTNGAYDDIAVVLDTVPDSSFMGEDSVTGTKTFKLRLTKTNSTTACDQATNQGLKGIGLSVPANGYVATKPSVIVNTAYAGAGQVNLQILTNNDVPVTFNTTYPSQPRSIVIADDGGFATLTYKAQYIAADATSVAQPVQALLTYTLEYN